MPNKNDVSKMPAPKLRQLAAELGIETKNVKIPVLRKEVEAHMAAEEKPAKGKAKGKKGLSKGKKAPLRAEKAAEAAETSGLSMEEILDTVMAKLTPKMKAIEARVKALEEAASADDSDDDDGEAAVPDELAEFADEEGGLDINPENVGKLSKAQCDALISYAGLEPDDSVKGLKGKRAFLKEWIESLEQFDDDGNPVGGETIEGPEGETATPIDPTELEGGESVYLTEDGETWIAATVDEEPFGEDDDGDAFLAVTTTDGDEAQIFYGLDEDEQAVRLVGLNADE